MAAAVRAAAIGAAKTTSAITMAHQVYSRPVPPSGPLRVNNPHVRRPTTTVGKASIVFSAVITARRPQNRVVPTTNPAGMPTAQAKMVEKSATLSESAVMPKTSASPLKISWAPRRRPSMKKSNGYYNFNAYAKPNTKVAWWVHSDLLSTAGSNSGGSSGAFAGVSKKTFG